MTHIYIASTFANRERLRPIRNELERKGHQVYSRWLDIDTVRGLDLGNMARLDIEDIQKAGLFILDNEEHPTRPTRGGRYVELGYVLGLKFHVIWLIGPRTNPFTYLSNIRHFETWEEALLEL